MKTKSACEHKNIANMDGLKFDMDSRLSLPTVNRLCMKCYQHWHGTPDNIKEYTKAEWDAWISTAFDADMPVTTIATELAGSVEVIESLKDFCERHITCATCAHGIDKDMFGKVFCDQEESMAGGWNLPHMACEEHYFRDVAMREKQDQVVKAHAARRTQAGVST